MQRWRTKVCTNWNSREEIKSSDHPPKKSLFENLLFAELCSDDIGGPTKKKVKWKEWVEAAWKWKLLPSVLKPVCCWQRYYFAQPPFRLRNRSALRCRMPRARVWSRYVCANLADTQEAAADSLLSILPMCVTKHVTHFNHDLVALTLRVVFVENSSAAAGAPLCSITLRTASDLKATNDRPQSWLGIS